MGRTLRVIRILVSLTVFAVALITHLVYFSTHIATLIFIGYDLLFEWLWEIREKLLLTEYLTLIGEWF